RAIVGDMNPLGWAKSHYVITGQCPVMTYHADSYTRLPPDDIARPGSQPDTFFDPRCWGPSLWCT
ncbi:MAG TPA: hypothetical protein VMK13_12365, partial [Streptosporangiaceae bacterium]|nr:hypothetical protein [Streptosporangiaceae bacterium]